MFFLKACKPCHCTSQCSVSVASACWDSTSLLRKVLRLAGAKLGHRWEDQDVPTPSEANPQKFRLISVMKDADLSLFCVNCRQLAMPQCIHSRCCTNFVVALWGGIYLHKARFNWFVVSQIIPIPISESEEGCK